MQLSKRVVQLGLAAALTLSSALAMAADKVLIVVTSHSQMGNTSEKTGYWLGEVTHPYQELVNAGIEVDIASIAGGKAPVDERSLAEADKVNQWFMADNIHSNKLQQTLKLADLKAADYRAVLFAGGHGTMWDFPQDKTLQQFAADLYQNDGIVAAVCHGPAALLNIKLADGSYLISGKEVTGFSNSEEEQVKLTQVVPFSLQDELIKRGSSYSAAANWQSKVVVDQRLVTGQNPQSATAVGAALVQLLTTK
ncbi:type 1 glutamine amidotransferase domain-containing protein [Rheinheimera sp. 1928-s]|uniref:type 1 glutamine amidotransferase domain-containing protein n=1 Tax=Rheinheimera sp. 1928-s TaxID=3033803 RepID=UPI002608720F|nr:type 1 glutamine amidotransferase domain-containing protein [Rheinheimera sp. 1928-s]MDF3125900.1 type 1 glutamine amidotransferase domain-containing protein [Rheinheimera sp. 1928-s]